MTTMAAETIFGIMRHATTVWNQEKRIQGQARTVLSSDGIDEAVAWARALRYYGWTRLVCSDLTRARHTADIVNESLRLPLEEDARLREQDWGDWVGRSIREIRRDEGVDLRAMENLGWDFRPPDGESRREVLTRALAALRDAAERHPGERVLVITHLGVIKCVVYRLMGRDFLPAEPDPLGKRALHRLSCRDGRLAIMNINESLV